jgi:CheY-like chemotaxis protein
MATATKVLVAAAPDMDEQIRSCLPGHDLAFVRTMTEAVRSLRHDGFQLIVIDLDFDESRMLELLQYIRTLSHYKEVPVVCVHSGDQVHLSEAVMKNIDVAVKALGGVGFLDLEDDGPHHARNCSFLERVAHQSGTSLRAG